MMKREGGFIWVASRSRPLRNVRGQVAGYSGTMRDITQHRQMEEALRESEERYRTLIETSPDAITLADMDDKLIMVNREAARIHGYENPEEMMSSVVSPSELIAPEDRPRAVENAQKTLTQGRVDDVEYTFLRKDGSTFPAELSASLIMNGGSTPKAFIAVTRDITERKEIENRSQQQERLAAVGQLAAGIAHDFNNILTGIIGYAQLLNMHPDIPESAKEDLSSIEAEGQRAANLIRQVLDFSRRSVMRRQPLDLVPFLKESLKFLKRTIPENVHIFMCWPARCGTCWMMRSRAECGMRNVGDKR